MRFLKYGPGQFFREHCDGHYEDAVTFQRSFYTLHLYLNDSAAGLGLDDSPSSSEKGNDEEETEEILEGKMLKGGATTFWSRDRKRRLDVDPKAGRVLIFQHTRLLHSGDDVIEGTK